MNKLSNKTKRICRTFVRLNEMVKMMMAELAVSKQGTTEFDNDEDFMIRAEAFAHVTAELLTVIFSGNGERIEDIVKFMDSCVKTQRAELSGHIETMLDAMANPN